jgi:hypothetical protein
MWMSQHRTLRPHSGDIFADEMAGLREFHDFARMGGGLDLWVKSYNEEKPL